MSATGYRFRPGFWPTVAALLLLPLLLGLGFWQLDRAAEKRAMRAEIEAAIAAEPVRLNETARPRAVGVPRAVVADGRYDRQRQFLLDNQTREGRVGYRILTPLRLAGSRAAVLVDRGWIEAPARRSQVPEPEVPAGRRTVTGVSGHGPSVGLRLGPPYAGDGQWPRRIGYVDFEYFAEALPYPVLPYLVEPEGSANATLEAVAGFGPERHVGYAVQWFALAAALVVIYVVVNLRRR